MEWVKEVIDTYSSRVNSRIVGSIITAFIAINWQPLFFMIFTDKSATTKFNYWDSYTDIWSNGVYPIAIGLLLSQLIPWIEYWGGHLVALPTVRLNEVKENVRNKKLELRLEHETTREELIARRKAAIAEQAQAENTVSEIDNDEIRDRAEKKIGSFEEEFTPQPTKTLSDWYDDNDSKLISNEDHTQSALVLNIIQMRNKLAEFHQSPEILENDPVVKGLRETLQMAEFELERIKNHQLK